MDITDEAAQFPKTAKGNAHYRELHNSDNSSRAELCRWTVPRRAHRLWWRTRVDTNNRVQAL